MPPAARPGPRGSGPLAGRSGRSDRSTLGSFLVVALALLTMTACGRGCGREPERVVYDLAARTAVAQRWSEPETIVFGTRAAEPMQREGFWREGGASGEPFAWVRQEAQVAFTLEAPRSRAAALDIAAYKGVPDQSVTLLLNGAPVGDLRLSDLRSRHRITLPAAAQKAGENILTLAFRGAASPADIDPKSPDRRRLAAQLFALTVGPGDGPVVDELLLREAPRPFGVVERAGAPVLSLVGPSMVRYALRVPERGELRFTPELHAHARAAQASATFRVTVEEEGRPGVERTLWQRVLGPKDPPPPEVIVSLPGRAGRLVRLGLAVSGTGGGRFAWGAFVAPRVMGVGIADPLEPTQPTAVEEERAEGLRKALAGKNVVLIILDAGRAASFGAYGYSRKTTPEIDRIASEGVVFENCFTPAVYTLGAMSSLWTSEPPDRHHGDLSFSAPLPANRLTLADLLSGQGIHTAGFVANPIAGALNRFDRGFVEFHEVWREVGSAADSFRSVWPSWLAKNGDNRFFAYLHFREPHFPYDPPPPFDTQFGPDGPIPKSVRRDSSWITDVNQGRRAFSDAERDHLVRLYDGNLAFADREVGELRRALEAAGQLDKTVLVVAADHGEALYERNWIGHNVELYDESVHVPLIVRLPRGTLPDARRVKGFVDLLDLAPTIADIFGVRGKGGSDKAFLGRSLLPLVAGGEGKSAVLSRTVWDQPRYAMRDASHVYWYESRTGAERLHDLKADPREEKDLAASDPIRAAFYRESLFAWTRSTPSSERQGDEKAAAMTKEQCETLKSLGYLPAGFPCKGE